MASRFWNARLAALAFTCLGCQSQTNIGLSDADRASIRQADEAFAKAANAKDFAAAAANYADDASLLPPNGEAVKGRVAIQKWMEAFPPMSNCRVELVDVDGRGDLAYTRGNYSLTMMPPGAAPTEDHGKFVEIWRKQPDGSWKIKWDIFNSDVAPPVPPKTTT